MKSLKRKKNKSDEKANTATKTSFTWKLLFSPFLFFKIFENISKLSWDGQIASNIGTLVFTTAVADENTIKS